MADLIDKGRPVVLMFGSLTCGPFCRSVGSVEQSYQRNQEHAEYIFVYIRDAHPSDQASSIGPSRSSRKTRSIPQPKTARERREAARQIVEQQRITIPTAIDDMNDSTAWKYAAFPDRLYVIDERGYIAYRSAPGPFGFIPRQMDDALNALLAKRTNPGKQPSSRTTGMLFSRAPKTLIVHGYSTSFHWPKVLQRKLDKYFGERIIIVRNATKARTPIAKWMDVDTGRPLHPWERLLRPAIKASRAPVIVLAQQSLQGSFADRFEGIRDEQDKTRIVRGADVLQRYTEQIFADGAKQIFIATHIYKVTMEPQIGNERLALAEFMRRGVDNVYPGPDVWTPTKENYPAAFASDQIHPNDIGAEIIAQRWFETLLEHDGRDAPAWSHDELRSALDGQPSGLAESSNPGREGPRALNPRILEKYDVDQDGELNGSEWQTFRQALRERRARRSR